MAFQWFVQWKKNKVIWIKLTTRFEEHSRSFTTISANAKIRCFELERVWHLFHVKIACNNKVRLKMSLVAAVQRQRNIWKKLCHNGAKPKEFLKNSLLCRCYSSGPKFGLTDQTDAQSKLFDFQHNWPEDVKQEFLQDMILIEDFVSEAEEESLSTETKKSMRRMRYQYDHWDDAIHGYREMEKTNWWPENESIFQRVRHRAFVANVLPHVHILDLAADGIIKPHVDSSRYCGSTIAGLSLLTDCIMRMRRVDEIQYKQGRLGDQENEPNQVNQQRTSEPSPSPPPSQFNYFADVLLKRRSLYIMKDSARYKFSHEVLATDSLFHGSPIVKGRRISIICRNQAWGSFFEESSPKRLFTKTKVFSL